ncbi:MAG: hypothetical protein ACLGJC_10120 [Alphaproteobacteria bacterium]
MTILCALHKPGVGTWIGSDRRVSAGSTIMSDTTLKWAMVDGGAVAITGSNALRTAMFDRASEVSADWMASQFRDWLVDLRTSLGIRPKVEEGSETWFHGNAMLVSATRIMQLDGAGGAWAHEGNVLFTAGSGCDYASGAAFALRAYGITDPMTIVKVAVCAAIQHDAGCGGEPFLHLLAE